MAQSGETAEPMALSTVQGQFASRSEAYLQSAVHAQGASLARIIELAQAEPDGVALDVATGAGHTAYHLAGAIGRVIAADATHEMVRLVRRQAAERGLAGLTALQAAAEALPLAAGSVDLVTCRIAAHHFTSITDFLSECRRLLGPGARLIVVDNVVPGSRGAGQKARLQNVAGRYVNAFERLRDPSHGRCLPLHEWREQLAAAGFTLAHQESAPKRLDFEEWAARMGVSPLVLARLRAMLLQAPAEVRDFLKPEFSAGHLTFALEEAILVALAP
jgi:ubiquinone/menaquinone biosynthesis C-methylase UbiE